MMILHALASLRLTLPGMLLLAAGVLVRYLDAGASVFWIALPLLLLAINLLAALLVNPRFRSQPPLLIFHICLLLLVVLISASQLTSLQGQLEITEGQAFSADAVEVVHQGPWHPRQRLQDVAFTQGPVSIDYNPGLKRVRTESRVQAPVAQAGDPLMVIGDNTPLHAAGYRLYTTPNKGFAAILTRVDGAGNESTGAVHFPSYPINDWRQLNGWTSPDGEQLALELVFIEQPDFERSWTLASGRVATALRVTARGNTRVLQPGETLQVGDATLRFQTVRLWMGYEIRYEPLLPWMFATALIGVLALAWHFQLRLVARVPGATDVPRRTGEIQGNAVTRF